MRNLVYAHQRNVALLMAMWRWCHGLVAGWFSPDEPSGRGTRRRRSWAHLIGVAVIITALVLQAVLIYVAGELIDLSISLMELWAELARKHLELTL
jgi:hypothetical protein